MTNTEQKWLREIRDNTKQLERIAKRLDAIHRQLDRLDCKDEPQSKSQYNFGERFPSYIAENNAQVLDGWQTNSRTLTTAVEDEP